MAIKAKTQAIKHNLGVCFAAMGVMHSAPEFVLRMVKSSDIKNQKQFLEDFNKQVLEIVRTANLPITKVESVT
jgi:hypothetical protein